jgi:hypothetical protein
MLPENFNAAHERLSAEVKESKSLFARMAAAFALLALTALLVYISFLVDSNIHPDLPIGLQIIACLTLAGSAAVGKYGW